MKLWKLALCASAATFGMVGAAFADAAPAEEPKPSIVFNAGVASEYLFRGLSQTRNGVEVFGGADLTYSKLYAGIWVSNVDFGKNVGNTTTGEIDFYGGVRPSIGPVNLDIGGIAYTYTGQPAGLAGTETYFEAKGAASISVGKATIGGLIAYSPEFPIKTGHSTYIEGNASVPVWKGLSVSGAVGHQFLEASKNFGFSGYTTYNIGATYAFNSHISLDGRFVGNSGGAKAFYGAGRNVAFNARDRAVVTLKVTFP